MIVSPASERSAGAAIGVLVGTTITTGHILLDLDGTHGMFFVFADLSVRLIGRYRLKFTVFDASGPKAASLSQPLISSVFEVFSPKTFPGHFDSTPLSRHLQNQAMLRIRTKVRVRDGEGGEGANDGGGEGVNDEGTEDPNGEVTEGPNDEGTEGLSFEGAEGPNDGAAGAKGEQ
ncbi:velvet factor-domain-containing protein [Blyttiomyces helicus]|uniref:Velvet factor-domain-containing protein n=1 Tax=Blyttiomyces helicus TaxID=388810 RepID=A0A4P9WJT7_9FUNG|nr:velvet factor-domain-containing protein [Blyttiomyces helicus]|eukprot:RKO92233.1 velvet factor-domain-containing protein [Blyttiomyces helicus]